jgi:cell fate regulator YaaT (PSP1 superfamily)
MSCGSGGCGSGACGAGSVAGATGGGCGVGATGGCGNGGCGAQAWDGAYRPVVGVQIGIQSRTCYFDSGDYDLATGDYCVVMGDPGEDFGRVVQATGPSRKFAGSATLRRVLRPATDEDLQTWERGRAIAREAAEYGRSKIRTLNLDFKVVDVDCSFDGRRMTFSFTSEERVDFRDLVRDLAQQYKRRIEMRQIGARDEAKYIGGYGVCGRALCCTSFLRDFPQISIRMAKRQGVATNPSKISGLCGRLMCCLRYEDHDDPGKSAPAPDPAPVSSTAA